MGEPRTVEFYHRGRIATRAEIQASIDTGLPLLQDGAMRDGAEAMKILGEWVERFRKFLPAGE